MSDIIRIILATSILVVFLGVTLLGIFYSIKTNYIKPKNEDILNSIKGAMLLSGLFAFLSFNHLQVLIGKHYIEGFIIDRSYLEPSPIYPNTQKANIIESIFNYVIGIGIFGAFCIIMITPKNSDKNDYFIEAREYPKIILSLLFLFAIFPLPYWYYSCLRILASISFLLFFRNSIKKKKKILPFIYLLLTVLFIKFNPVSFTKENWILIDMFLITFLVSLIYFNLKKNTEH